MNQHIRANFRYLGRDEEGTQTPLATLALGSGSCRDYALLFIEAARSLGASDTRIMRREILPNLVAPIIVYGTVLIPQNIIYEASLSFLGLGIPEPYPSWGRMLSESAAEYVRTAPWLVIFPGIAISLAALGLNLLGDGLRDVLDPRLKGAG